MVIGMKVKEYRKQSADMSVKASCSNHCNFNVRSEGVKDD